MKNKKGLSAIIITLMMIAFVLVAIGIVWVVINNVLDKSQEDIGISMKCSDVTLTPTLSCTGSICNVSIKRGSAGENITGVKVVFYNDAGDASSVFSFDKNIEALGTGLMENQNTGITNPTKVEVTAYFGEILNPQICGATFSSD